MSPPNPNHMRELHERSGSVNYNDPLVGFLYDLMRDVLPPGEVEALVMNQTGDMTAYTNGWLANYANDLAERLRKAP